MITLVLTHSKSLIKLDLIKLFLINNENEPK